jgi:cold shock CspA family protein
MPFDASAFDKGGFRLLRPGQRVRIEVEDVEGVEGEDNARRITLITLHTL